MLGSPPPMRGKDFARCIIAPAVRITPAYAGKSYRQIRRSLQARDHPRLCGEKAPETVYHIKEKGSPPPMRGKASTSKQKRSPQRITPAYAGKSCGLCTPSRPSWDHPRLCGEKWNAPQKCWCRKGSPPPMRGKARTASGTSMAGRITPAYAGKRILKFAGKPWC